MERVTVDYFRLTEQVCLVTDNISGSNSKPVSLFISQTTVKNNPAAAAFRVAQISGSPHSREIGQLFVRVRPAPGTVLLKALEA